MSDNQEQKNKNEQVLEENKDAKQQKRKYYQKPYLEKIGDLRTLTLGASVGATIETGYTYYNFP